MMMMPTPTPHPSPPEEPLTYQQIEDACRHMRECLAAPFEATAAPPESEWGVFELVDTPGWVEVVGSFGRAWMTLDAYLAIEAE